MILFGPTPPSRWGPPADRPWHRVIWKGRTGDPNAMSPDPGLLSIDEDDVIDAAVTLAAPVGPMPSARAAQDAGF